MKRYLFACLSVMAVLMVGCEKTDDVTAVTLNSITKETFDYKGGLASAVVDAGGARLKAESDQEWCKVAVFGTAVSFNVSSFTEGQDRMAVITVSSDGLTPLTINITQTRFAGLIVVPTSIIFSNIVRSIPIEVTASAEYSVSFSENPDDAFSYEKTETGVTFTSNKAAGEFDVAGRAVLTPTEGDKVIISLTQPKKSIYNMMLGTWSVINNDADWGEKLLPPTTFTFSMKEEDFTYNVHIDNSFFGPDNCFIADFKDGEVVIQSGQQMGTMDVGGTTMYLNLHFNGTQGGSGNYIFSGPGSVAWGATPEFNESLGTVSLDFADNGQGQGRKAVIMCLFRGPEKHFNFIENIGTAQSLKLRKMTAE